MPIDKVLSTSIADGAVTASAISNTANLSITSLLTSSNTVTIGTAAYFVGSGSVGIGTSSPDARLQVQGAASTQLILRDTSAYSAGVNGGGILFQGLDSASNNRSLSSIQGIGDGSNSGGLTLSTRSAGSLIERMRIDSSGNVVIGHTTASYRFQVRAAKNTTGIFLQQANVDATNDYSEIGFGSAGGTSTVYSAIRNLFTNPAGDSSTALTFSTTNVSTFAERMRIDSSGNVGIGTSSPSYKLDVDRASVGIVARFKGGTRSAHIYSDNDAVYFTSDTNVATAFGCNEASDFLTFYTGNSERMRITSSGNVGIGTTSPSTKLHVAGIINSQSIYTGSYTQDMYGSTNLPIDLGQNESTGMIVILSSSLGCTGFGAVVSVIGHYTRGEASLNIIHNNARYGTMSYSIDSSQNFAVFLRVNAASLGWGCGGVKPSTATVFYTIINGSSKYSTGF